MSMMSTAPAAVQRRAGQSWINALGAALRRRWLAYITWRFEQAAVAQLGSMSDRELKDIGLTRSEISHAVKAGAPRDRAFSRCY